MKYTCPVCVANDEPNPTTMGRPGMCARCYVKARKLEKIRQSPARVNEATGGPEE